MKYLTKEWYKTMGKTDICLFLEISKRVETFSEEYYNELYKQKESEWIKKQEEISNVKFKEDFPEYADISRLKENELKEREGFL